MVNLRHLWAPMGHDLDLPKPVPTLFQPLGTTRTFKSPLRAVFGCPWAKFWGAQLLQIGSKTLTWTSQSPFQLRSTLFEPFGTTGTFKLPFWSIWAVFGGPWAKFGSNPLLQIGSKSLTWTSHSPFHLRSTLFQPFGTTRTFRSPFWPIWAVFGPWRSQI